MRPQTLVLLIALSVLIAACAPDDEPGVEQNGDEVSFGDTVAVHYTGTLQNGEVFDTSEGQEPIVFEVGAGQIIPGFEDAIVGLSEGESTQVTLPPAEAYGERQEDFTQAVPIEEFGEELTVDEGDMITMQTPDGQIVPATIVEITDDTVVLDMNHPLAGETLTFDITVVEIGAEQPMPDFVIE